MVRVLHAARYAAVAHGPNRPWGASGETGIHHALEVADLCARAVRAAAPELVEAALLHDVVETARASLAEIRSDVGDEVADIVAELTPDPAWTEEERWQQEIERAPGRSLAAQAILVADLVVNLRATLRQPGPDCPVERTAAWGAWTRQVRARLSNPPPELAAEFDRLHRQLDLFIRLARRGVGPELQVLAVRYHQFGPIAVLREAWRQDGIEGDSAVFLAEQVGTWNDDELVEFLRGRMQLDPVGPAITRRGDWVRVNWGLRLVNSLL
jgi:guanosine-3',5'-bis(diphosphate) 3'-pyrophosphohydrolase